MASNQETSFNISDIENVGHRPKKVQHVFTEQCKNALNVKAEICAEIIYYKTERADKLCGVCILEIGGEMFESLSIVRKHVRDHSNTLSLGYCDDCGNRLYQLMTKDVCPDCRD